MLIRNFDENLKYYLQKFGKGEFIGPHYIFKKSKNIKIKGNFESVYDFSYLFIKEAKNNKIDKKAIILVPKDLNFKTDLEILKEKIETRYKKLEVKGEGFFEAPYFLFFGKVENEFGKMQTKKPRSIKEEGDKNYFSFLKVDTTSEFMDKLKLPEFKKELEYKVNINIKDLKIVEKKFVVKKVEIIETFLIDKEKELKETKEIEVKHNV
jgi:hypothetical protein